MNISDTLLPEFDQEMATTRKTLERVPEGKAAWKPHVKSMDLGHLSAHLANLPTWATMTLATETLDVAPAGKPAFETPQASSTAELVKMFDKNVAEARAAIAKASNDEWMKPWSLLAGGKTLMTMPRAAVYRGMIMNHSIHHRAQLGVYLRLNDVAVPGAYGPSADEKG